MPNQVEVALALAEAQVLRDVRVDQIGFVGELQRQHADGLKTRVKVRMLESEADRVAGDAFDGLLVTASAEAIDVDRLLRMYDRKRVTRAQLLSCLSAKKEAAAQFLSRDQIAQISTRQPPVHSLRVTRKKGVEVSLVDAVRELGRGLALP